MQFTKPALDRIDYLAGRWQDESAYENFGDYAIELKKVCDGEGFTFVNACQRPFGFNFRKDGKQFRLTVGSKTITIKEVTMVTTKKNPAPKKKVSTAAVAKKPAVDHAAIAKAVKKATKIDDPNDITKLPPALDRLKDKTKAEIDALKAKADQADRAEQTEWKMPSTNPVTAKTAAKSAIPAGALTPKQIADEVGMNDRKLRRLLRAMAKKGTLKHDANGRWAITKADLPAIKAAATTSKK